MKSPGYVGRLSSVLVTAMLIFGISPLGAGTVQAGEIGHPYSSDPLGLVAHYDLTSSRASGEDVFELWVCELAGGPYGLPPIDVEMFSANLSDIIGQYWEWHSGGAYRLQITPGGRLRDPESGCWEGARSASGGGSSGVLVVEVNSFYFLGGTGTGGAGTTCWSETSIRWCENDYPKNHRGALVTTGGGTTLSLMLSSVIHEMGHALVMPHSYWGTLPADHPQREYDNPMDIMSGGGQSHYPVGIVAANRYAAGWLPAEQVTVFGGGHQVIHLDAFGGDGMQMLALPSGEQGVWLSIGARQLSVFDVVPEDGVEAYLVDQRLSACDPHFVSLGNSACWGANRRMTPYSTEGAAPSSDPFAHVMGVGGSLQWNGVSVSVVARTGTGFVVEVDDGSDGGHGWFVDDDGSSHEADIEMIAALGITVGCAVEPQPRYCPDLFVTRAEMAAFLVRAMRLSQSGLGETRFADVPADVWYTGYVETLAQSGIDTGENGRWRPNDALTRLEMAGWLNSAFDHIQPASNPTGIFSDVGVDNWYAVEGLYALGVTKGCSSDPLLYCPREPVTRAQMASFLIRALAGAR